MARGSVGRLPVTVAKAIYRATPIPALRQLYFSGFCRLVRGRKVIATIGGSTYELDLGETIDVALYLDQYERDVAAALQRYCQPGMTVLDIGANIGAHTLALGRLVTKQGAVYAFEPMSFAFRKLSRNVSLNDAAHIHPVNAALGEARAEGLVLNYRSSWQTIGGRADDAARVDVIRLDDWCRAHAVDDVGLIKIDVDGNEFDAFAGGAELLRRCRPVIVMEAVSPHFASDDRNPFLMLQRLGYRFFDTKSETEYPSVQALARFLPAGDDAMTMSLNVIARPLGVDPKKNLPSHNTVDH
jgi:FkbM family methyltransferase